jgi:hypothetical protein
MTPPAFPATRGSRHRKNKGAMSPELPLRYIHGSMGTTGIEDKLKRPRQNIFSLVGSGAILQYGIADPILTLLSRPLRHVCQVTV